MKGAKPGKDIIILFLTVIFTLFFAANFLFAEQQKIIIKPGWNLISIQLEPADPRIETIFFDWINNGYSFTVWEYDAAYESWRTYQHPEHFFLNNITGLSITEIKPKKGYWINSGHFTNYELIIEGEPATGGINIQSAWNLVGFTGFHSESFGEMDIDNILGEKKAMVEEIWFYNRDLGEGYKAHMTDGTKREFSTVVPGRGYWIKTNAGFSLLPVLGITLEADIDLPPLRTQIAFPGPEDEDLGGDGIYDNGQDQSYISFRDRFEYRYINIANFGEGILNWSLTGLEELDWLDADVLSGSTTTETDIITLGACRDGLLPGDYEGTITVQADTGSKQITVLMNVPPLDGDYQGTAKIYLVNGQPADVADVDLYLRIFENDQGEIKGIIDKDKSVLFPVDVHLSGHIYEGTNQNVIRGKYRLAAGPDALNPFPFSLEREIMLIGNRSTINSIEGFYQETILNALPRPIVTAGTFLLSRQKTLTPWSYEDVPSQITNIPDGGVIEREIIIDEKLLINEINIWVKINHIHTEDLQVYLITPDDQTIMLHDHQTGINIDTVYDTLTWPLPQNAFENLKGTNAQGTWRLVIEDTVSGTNGRLPGWGINIIGVPSFTLAGFIKDESGNAFEGAAITLFNGPIIKTLYSGVNGRFQFSGLGNGEYHLHLAKIGCISKDISVWIENGDVSLNNIILSSINVENCQMIAAPQKGQKALQVTFALLAPRGVIQPGDIISWDFGDGTTLEATSTETEHSYSDAGCYTVQASLFDGSKTTQRAHTSQVDFIHVYEGPDVSYLNFVVS